MEYLSVIEAAIRKKCTGQAVRNAIRAGYLDAMQIGRPYIVKANKSFNEWTPNPKSQNAGRTRLKKRKRK